MTKASWFEKVQNFFWAVFLLTLPVTSFPYFPSGFGGSTLVRPLSLYPLLVLAVITIVPRLWRRDLPRTILPFLAFVLIGVGSTAIGTFRGIDPVVGVDVADRAIRTLVTLFIGGGFYLAAALIPDSPKKLQSTLRWLYAGFSVALAWGSLQVVYVLYFHRGYFEVLKRLQRFVSIRKLFPTRISGMTYEPNWFAEQIAFLLMPWLFAAVISGFSVFRWRFRWRWLSVEFLLLLWAAGVLLFTYSRSGIILFAIQLFLVFLIRPGKRKPKDERRSRRWRAVGIRAAQASLVLVVLAGVVFAAGSRNNYFSRIWNYWTDEERTGAYLQYIAFDQRITYWETAYRIYADYPVFGVGLGNFTYYFDAYLADRPLHPTPELLTKLTPEAGRSQLSTVKGLFPRVLAETGTLGMGVFVSFLTAVLGCVVYLLSCRDDTAQYWGKAGILVMVVFFAVSFSFDSFSLPNMWVVLGLITAAPHVLSGKRMDKDMRV